jgi:hypothetical protein
MWRIWIAVIVEVTLHTSTWQASAYANPPQSFDIVPVVEQIKEEIRAAQEEGRDTGYLFRIDRVVLDLKLVAISDDNTTLGYKFAVAGIDFGANAAAAGMQTLQRTVEIEMKPYEDMPVSGSETLGIADAIIALKDAVRAALETPPEFDVQKVTFSIDFALRRNLEAGFSFVILGHTQGRTRESVQSILLEMSLYE